MPMKDWVGRKVILRNDVRTRGGTIFPAGTVMKCYGHCHGKLKLDWVDENGTVTGSVRGVLTREVEVVEGDRPQVIQKPRLRYYIELSRRDVLYLLGVIERDGHSPTGDRLLQDLNRLGVRL